MTSAGDTLLGDWDEVAQGPMSCCDLHALRGDQHIEMDWTGTRLSSMTAAGTLLNSAVKHLDHPLSIDGTVGIPPAQQEFSNEAKDSTANMCSLVPQAAAESALGAKLSGPPQPGQAKGGAGLRDCNYQTAVAGGNMSDTYELTLAEWHDGAVKFAEDQQAIGMAGRAMQRRFTGDTTTPQPDTSDYPVGPWDEAAIAPSAGYEAVKGPLLIKVGAFGNKKATLALLARAVTAVSSTQ